VALVTDDDAPCGDLTALPDGTILHLNRTLAAWTGRDQAAAGQGLRLQSLLTTPSALLFETHCVPLLQLQGFINEVSLDLVSASGQRQPVLLCATAKRDEAGATALLRLMIFNAPKRREYERELVAARTAAEQATAQLRSERELAERKVAEQAALLRAVGRMAAGDLTTPITLEIDSSLLPLASELERLRRDILWQLQALKERNDEIHKLNRELRYQIEQRSLKLVESLGARMEHRAAQPSAPRPAGAVLAGRYRLEHLLGRGGMATVYQIERISDGRRFAAKFLSVRPDYQVLVRFAREAQFLARLAHPNLISIIDIDVTEDRVPYIVMELAGGRSLAEHAHRYGERAFVLPVLTQIAAALDAVHAAGVVHRDLKPSNVLLFAAERGAAATVKLVDFGISLLLDPGVTPTPPPPPPSAPTPAHQTQVDLHPRRRGPADELTQIGALLGTPNYMAPELAAGSRLAQAASDLFSFGVLAYELLTGDLPFSEPPILQVIANKGVLTCEPLAKRCPDLHPALIAALERCLAVDPASRPTAHELASALGVDLPADRVCAALSAPEVG
jgi:hypothetical protein